MRTEGTTSAIVSRQPGQAAKMVAVFMLGAASSAGIMYGFMLKPAPATIQAAPPPAQPIVVQLVQPAPTVPQAGVGGVSVASVAQTPHTPPTATTPAGPPASGETPSITTSSSHGPDAAPTTSPATALVPAVTVGPAVTVVPAPGDRPSAAKPEATRIASSHALINLNSASQAELESLPLVGPSMARRIIEHRTKNGPFKQTKDLDKVKGIGEKTLAKLLPLVTVDAGR